MVVSGRYYVVNTYSVLGRRLVHGGRASGFLGFVCDYFVCLFSLKKSQYG
jgi:hypothetical protein